MPDLSSLSPWQWGLLVAAVFMVLAHYKTGRADGTFVRNVHPYRRLMWFVMPTRNECVVYYEDKIRAERLEAYLERVRPTLGCNITHAYVAALNVAIAESPTMDQFVIGRRIYKRKERSITFSMKRKAKDAKAKIAVVRMPMNDAESFSGLSARINASINHQRSGKKTHADQEYQLFDLLPRTALRFFVWVFHALDYINLLPYAFTKEDALYSSAVVANLGSLEMDAAYHHLYEWGTASVFATVGRIKEEPVVVDGKIEVGKVLTVRYSYDERIDDGLSARKAIWRVNEILADPETHLGCIGDETEHGPMVTRLEG